METLRPRLKPVDEATRCGLIDACQQNDWLKRWDHSPMDELSMERPFYDFAQADTLEDLRQAFEYGNWRIRQGFVYRDLAFIQQIDGDDEWWSLKRTPYCWIGYSNMNCTELASDKDGFRLLMTSLLMASPEQCHEQRYMLPKDSPEWEYAEELVLELTLNVKLCRSYTAEFLNYTIKISEKPDELGWTEEVFEGNPARLVCKANNHASALDAARSGIETAKLCRQFNIHAAFCASRDASLSERAGEARTAAASPITQAKGPLCIPRERR